MKLRCALGALAIAFCASSVAGDPVKPPPPPPPPPPYQPVPPGMFTPTRSQPLQPFALSKAGEVRTGAGLCLDVHAPEMANNGGRVQAWACNGAPQQRWAYDRAASALRVASGLCLDVNAGINQNGNAVQVWSCNGQWQQQWTPLENGSLRSAGGLCLDVHAPDQTKNGARVQIWQCNGSQQQRFRLSGL